MTIYAIVATIAAGYAAVLLRREYRARDAAETELSSVKERLRVTSVERNRLATSNKTLRQLLTAEKPASTHPVAVALDVASRIGHRIGGIL